MTKPGPLTPGPAGLFVGWLAAMAALTAGQSSPTEPPPVFPPPLPHQFHQQPDDTAIIRDMPALATPASTSSRKQTISAVESVSSVRLPPHYTAMEGDIEVSFTLDRPNAFEYNAIVHLEYLPGDAILPGEAHQARAQKLTSLPVPLGLQKGTVVFQCGAIKYAGPHRAFLTVNGKRVVESGILQVSWPPISITVPTRLETYSTDVAVTVSFTRSLCTTFAKYGGGGGGGDGGMQGPASPFFDTIRRKKKKKRARLGFETSLDLIECSNSLIDSDRQPCQAPSSPTDPRVWLRLPIENLYRKPSHTVNLNCSVWGGVGTFRLFLRTNLTHVSVVSRSPAIAVRGNPAYGIRSEESPYVFPCLMNDIKPLKIHRPGCAPRRDKIRVYGQAYEVVGNGNLMPATWHYLGEKGLEAYEDVVFVPCRFFKERYWKFCFHYVSTSMVGTTDTLAKICMPAKDNTHAIPVSSWGPWSTWTSCSRTCGNSGVRTRHRICLPPQNAQKSIICEGKAVQEKNCSLPNPCPINDEGLPASGQSPYVFDNRELPLWTPLFEDESISPCSCGCIYIVGSSRRIGITSAQDCSSAPYPLRWKVKVSENNTMKINVSLLQHSCIDGIVFIRDGDDHIHGDLLDKIGFFNKRRRGAQQSHSSMTVSDEASLTSLTSSEHLYTNEVVRSLSRSSHLTVSSFNTTKPVVTFELRGKSKNCRINMELNVVATSVSTKPESVLHSMVIWTKALAYSRHFPAVVLVLVSALLVSVACCLFLICQFEYHKKKYVSWKSANSSGYSTPTGGPTIREKDRADEPLLGAMRPRARPNTYVALEDIETAVSSMEELGPGFEERKKKQKRQDLRLRLAASPRPPPPPHCLARRRSLPSSPFLTRSMPTWEGSRCSSSRLITADQVKKALALKSLRYQRGHYDPIGRPVVPLPSPAEPLSTAQKRHSRSLSDVLSMLRHERKTSSSWGMDMARLDEKSLRQRGRGELKLRGQRRKKPANKSSSSLLKASISSLSSRPPSSFQARKRLTPNDALQRVSRYSLSRTESQDTLKANNARSQSSFSGRSSVMSGDQELEFDLYDYNLDNVVAYNPGSMFATPSFWLPAAELTPTNEEEFQMRELFPRDEAGSKEADDELMLRSRTSDLTASVTSAELRYVSHVPEPEPGECATDEDDEAHHESDALLGAKASNAAMLNLTHIDDDISFADDDLVPATGYPGRDAKPARRRFLNTQC